MNIDATVAMNVVFVWILIATPLAYFLARKRVESIAPVVFLHFILAFLPPLSLIALLLLANKDEKASATNIPAKE